MRKVRQGLGPMSSLKGGSLIPPDPMPTPTPLGWVSTGASLSFSFPTGLGAALPPYIPCPSANPSCPACCISVQALPSPSEIKPPTPHSAGSGAFFHRHLGLSWSKGQHGVSPLGLQQILVTEGETGLEKWSESPGHPAVNS